MGSAFKKPAEKETYCIRNYHPHDVIVKIGSKKYTVPAMGQYIVDFRMSTFTNLQCKECFMTIEGYLKISKDPEDQDGLYKITNIGQYLTYA